MFGLSFLYPLFLVAAAAAAIPIVLHLFRRRAETVVEFPAVRLLHKAPVEQQRRRRLRELILLALRVTALALLAAAFARPYFQDASALAPAPVTVVALDTSLSLSAPGQFERAREAARAAVQNAPATHLVALMTFADAASLALPPTTDRGSVLAAIDAAQVTSGGTRYRTALARAAEAIASGSGRIVVVSDLQQTGWDGGGDAAIPDGIDIEVAAVPAPPGNVAITAIRRDGQTIAAGIHNFGTRPVRVPVRLRVGEQDSAPQFVEVAPQAAAEARLAATLPARGGVAVTIDDPDGYAADDVRYLVLDPPAAVRVFVVTAHPPQASNAGIYVERALSLADDGRAFAVTVIEGAAFSALPAERFGEAGALVLLGTTTLDRQGRERVAAYLREGGRVLLTMGPDIDVATLSDVAGTDLAIEQAPVDTGGKTVTMIAVDVRHPVFRPFLDPSGALGDVQVARYRRLNDQEGRTVLARFSGAGSALIEETVGRGRLLVFASDLDNQWNRFPLNPSFVPFAIEAVRYLTHGREQPQSYTIPQVPAGGRAAPGIYELPVSPDERSRAGADGVRRVAVNVDVRESNPARVSVEEFSASIARRSGPGETRAQVEARQQEERQRLWQMGLLVMFLALAGEGFIGRKAV